MTEKEVEIQKTLNKNGVSASVYSEEREGKTLYEVSIEWGDWKHDHLFTRTLMANLGLTCLKEEVTEEDGSDCYSAVHTYCEV